MAQQNMIRNQNKLDSKLEPSHNFLHFLVAERNVAGLEKLNLKNFIKNGSHTIHLHWKSWQ
jgi:hypothetical protein